MARTKKENPSEVRTSVIRLRVTEDEVKRFKEKAAEAGCRTISQYIRLRCLDNNTFGDTHKKAAE